MSADRQPLTQRQKTLEIAHRLIAAGYKVFPCRPFSKQPATTNGLYDATNEPTAIAGWFDNDKGLNLAIACGPQPNGVNLFVVDVDPAHGGNETWKALCDQHGTPLAPRHTTPSGGFHLFFDAPAGLRNGRNALGPGIDHRGEGGYVVTFPSRLHNDDGEVIIYRGMEQTWLGANQPPGLPLWIIEGIEPTSPTVIVAPRPTPSGVGIDGLRQTWDWAVELEADGWSIGRPYQDGFLVTRPGKDPRQGCSAVAHPGGHLYVYSTNAPPELCHARRPGSIGRDGGLAFSPWDYLVEVRFGGDEDAAHAAMGWGEADRRATVKAPDADATPLYPPRDFYDQRPWMAMCRQMAEAVGGSPAAHTLAFMCRWATLIPPGFSIPPINGAPSSFDLLCVIAGTSGSGKTSPMRNAEELLPVLRKDLRMGLGIGSGEGIIESFYAVEMVKGDDGKGRKERRKAIAGVNFAVSEGLIFAELAGRGGTTHVTRLCDAWSGAALSTANATAETFRHIPANQYRLTLMMGIQADQAHELMTDSAASQGFVGRLLFVWAEEPRVSPRPVPPERLVVPVPGGPPPVAGVYQQTYLSYPPEVYAEIQGANDQRVGTNVPVEEHHHDLLRCKVAGILALMDERLSVSGDDWSIATALVDYSRGVRLHLYSIRRQNQRAQRHNAAVARGETELVIDDVKKRQQIARMASAIRTFVKDGGQARSKVRKGCSYADSRPLFEPALALAVSNGWVEIVESRIEPAG